MTDDRWPSGARAVNSGEGARPRALRRRSKPTDVYIIARLLNALGSANNPAAAAGTRSLPAVGSSKRSPGPHLSSVICHFRPGVSDDGAEVD